MNTFLGSSVRCPLLDRRGQESHADVTVAAELLAPDGSSEELRNTLESAVLSTQDPPASIGRELRLRQLSCSREQ